MSLYDYAQAHKEVLDILQPTNTPILPSPGVPVAELDINVKAAEPNDIINSPKHYARGKFEVWDVIEHFHLNYNMGNVCKYILRAGVKTADPLEDYKKARAYLDREIAIREGKTDFSR